MSEAGRGHQVGEAGVAYTIPAKLGGGRADNALPCFCRVLLRSSHVHCNRLAGGSIVIISFTFCDRRAGRTHQPYDSVLTLRCYMTSLSMSVNI
jgi:hypothetical protein